MAQPVRKIIKETHEDLVKEEPFYTLLIDGNSLLFFSMVDKKINSEGLHYGGVFQTLLQIKMMMSKRRFKYVYFTYDGKFSGWMRYNLYHAYKANRDKKYSEYGVSDYMKAYNEKLQSMQNYFFDKNKEKKPHIKTDWDKLIDENFDRERDILLSMFEECFIRTLTDEVSEGDDLIAYYCKNKKSNEKIYIMTGDMDISQLLADDICVYNLNLKKFITNKSFKEQFGYPCENIMVKKVFCGDTSDNISNIAGLSEDGFFKLMPEAKEKEVTIEDVKNRASLLIEERVKNKKKPLKIHENIVNGVSNKKYDGDFYSINKTIIDLKNPMMSNEAKEMMDSVMYAPQDPEGRSFGNLYELIKTNGIEELYGETKFASFFSPFKTYADDEIKYYEENK